MDVRHIVEAMSDPRVIRAVELALRDGAIRRRFQQMRRESVRVDDAVEQLAREECLSEEHVRTIVYRKRERAMVLGA